MSSWSKDAVARAVAATTAVARSSSTSRKSSSPRTSAKPRTHDNAAYIHKLCSQNQLEIIELDEDVSYLQPYDVLYILNLLTEADRGDMVLYPLPRKWK